MSDRQLGFEWTAKTATDQSGNLPEGKLALAKRLHQLARRGIYLGTSSWKYPGWLGQVYDPANYQTRGKFSQKKFEQQCLAEYASVFPTVSGDFVFYQFPSAASWRRTFEQVSDGFQFSLKIPEEVTVERYPELPRYGKRAGTSNAHFMDASLVIEQLLAPLEPYRSKLGVLMFQFGAIHDSPMSEPQNFAEQLDQMLTRLPTDRFKFAVEVRNPGFLDPPSDYLSCLKQHRVAHCLNSWTSMPSVAEQMKQPDIFTAQHVAVRFLLKPGRSYEQAVTQFSPYRHVQEPYPQGRAALSDLIDHCLSCQHTLYAFVNNRFEGNAVETIRWATE